MTFDRRDFLKAGASAMALPLLGGRLHAQTQAFSPLSLLAAAAPQTDRVLVIIRFDGGHDGLNTVLPLDNYDNLAKARANLLIPAAKALKIDAATGLHPA